MIKPTLYDTIELLIDLPENNLRGGIQGAIVHQYNESDFEVEFANSQGETESLCLLSLNQFIVIWQAETAQPVSVLEQVAQIVARLPEAPQVEVLDFARFLSVRKSSLKLEV